VGKAHANDSAITAAVKIAVPNAGMKGLLAEDGCIALPERLHYCTWVKPWYPKIYENYETQKGPRAIR
jgi:hypothetical protein